MWLFALFVNLLGFSVSMVNLSQFEGFWPRIGTVGLMAVQLFLALIAAKAWFKED